MKKILSLIIMLLILPTIAQRDMTVYSFEKPVTQKKSSAKASTAKATAKPDAKPVNTKPKFIDTIKKNSLEAECGCGFQLASDKKSANNHFIFVCDIDNNGIMNIEGQDVKLKLTSGKNNETDVKVGQKRSEDYSGEGFTVHIDYTVTRVCPKNDEDCEATDYSAVITVTKGTKKEQIKVLGSCGC